MSKRTAESFDAPYKFAKNTAETWMHSEWTAGAHEAPDDPIIADGVHAYATGAADAVLPGAEPADQQLPMLMHVDAVDIAADGAVVQDDADMEHADVLPEDAGPVGTDGWFKRWSVLPDGGFRCKWHFRRTVNN